jgi:hypothetical protein
MSSSFEVVWETLCAISPLPICAACSAHSNLDLIVRMLGEEY